MEPMSSSPSRTEPVNLVQVAPGETRDTVLEPRYVIFVHNDEVTPIKYVIRVLEQVFFLSDELAEHIAATAHQDGVAVVMVRPRDEARRLIMVAHSRARADGYPLTFTMEPEH